MIKYAYSYDSDAESLRTGLTCEDPSLTQQSMRDETDINVLVRRFGVTGSMPVPDRLPTYADFDDVFDYQSAQNAIIAANQAFYALDADLRNRFANSPQKFLEFVTDPANADELVRLGLATRKATDEPPPPAPPPTT